MSARPLDVSRSVCGDSNWLSAALRQHPASPINVDTDRDASVLFWCVGEDDLMALLDEHSLPTGAALFDEINVIVEEAMLIRRTTPQEFAAVVTHALSIQSGHAEPLLRVGILHATACGAMRACVDELLGLVFELRRRSPSCLQSRCLSLPVSDQLRLPHIGAESLVAHIVQTLSIGAPGLHYYYGQGGATLADLAQAVGHAVSVAIEAECAYALPRMRDGAESHAVPVPASLLNIHGVDADAIRYATEQWGAQTHGLPCEDWDLQRFVGERLQAHQFIDGQMLRPFLAVPGMTHHRLHNGSNRGYLRCGQGDTALVLINAFGLSMDFWQALATSLSPRLRILALHDDRSAPFANSAHLATNTATTGRLPETYYASDNDSDGFLRDVNEMLAQEGLDSCHLVSWCSGAKLALELAHAEPESIKSLTLLSPSFAGVDAAHGADAPYEHNLNMMCGLVGRMPNAAANMARSMMAILQKTAATSSSTQGNWALSELMERADASHQHLLSQPFSNGDNMLAYSRQLMNFRTHDIVDRLTSTPLAQPLMLVIGTNDTSTSAARAQQICRQVAQAMQVEVACGSHYLLQQNHALVADLLEGFTRLGTRLNSPHPRATLTVNNAPVEVVCGEL